MTRFLGSVCVAVATALAAAAPAARADEASDLIDKGIASMGGKEKLTKPGGFSARSKGTLSLGGQEGEISVKSLGADPDNSRSEVDFTFNGQTNKLTIVLKGDKGWMKRGDELMERDGDALAREKQRFRLTQAAMLAPLKGGKFKVEKSGEEKVGDKPAVALKVTDPEGKESKLYLDKETGLPLRQTATVPGFMGEDVDQESLFKDYKDFDGYKRPAKTEVNRNGERFLVTDLIAFNPMDMPPAGSFDRPE